MAVSRRELLCATFGAACVALGDAPVQAGELVHIFASEAKEVPYKFRRQEVRYKTSEPAGTIVIDTKKRFLYLVHGGGKATRYGVGVGAEGKNWSGEAVIKRRGFRVLENLLVDGKCQACANAIPGIWNAPNAFAN